MNTRTAHLAVYDGLTDSEVGHLLVELHTGRFTGTRFDVVTVGESREPVRTAGGLRTGPDALLDELEPADSDLLILPGAEVWDSGATAGLARAGLLDDRNHTNASAEYLAATGYAGGDRYLDDRAVVDGDLITAGPQSPVQFARATLDRLALASERTLEAYESLFDRADLAAFPVLMEAQGLG
jgi:DJ-1/PfpI family